ncbi:hypothetical protein [Dactylosporangium sp. NPDC000521]|uniref:hypothetical protein n=1 Tax=Dactylosporangium sp. NPDC000521 TaxID=3363975 RepID=UPI00368CFAB3
MPDSADLACYDHELVLPLGWFMHGDGPQSRWFFYADGRPGPSPQRTRALWRMLAEHAGHDVRLLGEETDWAEAYDFPRLPDVGGLGDIAFEQYLDGWPRSRSAPVTGPDLRPVSLVSIEDAVAMPLGLLDAAGAPDERYLVQPDGSPSEGVPLLTRAVWRMLATHVYRDVRLVLDVPSGFERLDEHFGVEAWPDAD